MSLTVQINIFFLIHSKKNMYFYMFYNDVLVVIKCNSGLYFVFSQDVHYFRVFWSFSQHQ